MHCSKNLKESVLVLYLGFVKTLQKLAQLHKAVKKLHQNNINIQGFPNQDNNCRGAVLKENFFAVEIFIVCSKLCRKRYFLATVTFEMYILEQKSCTTVAQCQAQNISLCFCQSSFFFHSPYPNTYSENMSLFSEEKSLVIDLALFFQVIQPHPGQRLILHRKYSIKFDLIFSIEHTSTLQYS